MSAACKHESDYLAVDLLPHQMYTAFLHIAPSNTTTLEYISTIFTSVFILKSIIVLKIILDYFSKFYLNIMKIILK